MTHTSTTPSERKQQQNDLCTPWTLHFEGDGTEDYAVIRDADGEDLAASRLFWQPEGDDPIPQTLAALLAMKAAPELLAALAAVLPYAKTEIAFINIRNDGGEKDEAEAVRANAALSRAIAAINGATEWPMYDAKPDDNALAA